MSQAQLSVPLIVVGTIAKNSMKTGVAKPFWITSAYVSMPGMKFPQACELYVPEVTQVLPPGDYLVPVNFSIKDNRPSLELDLVAARPATVKAA